VSNETLRIGFLPLVDAALPILAHELGFAEREGIALELVRDVTWATVRDRLLYGHTDAAHMVAPLALATALGRDRPATPIAVPFVLGLNGNAITFSTALGAECALGDSLGDPAAVGAERGGEGDRIAVQTQHEGHGGRRRAARRRRGTARAGPAAALRRGAPLFQPQLHAALLARGGRDPARP
jgi:ABC-type nitrate/sulfonate/bicarbonate transport system substrate-binding protein